MSLRAPSALAEGLLFGIVIAAPLAFGCVEPWSQSILEVACFLLAFVCLFRPERESPSSLPLLGVAALIGVGAFQSFHPVSPLDPLPAGPFTVSSRATAEALLLWTAYAALAWSVPRTLRDWEAAKRLAWAVVASGTVVAILGIAQDIAGEQKILGFRYTDSSPFGPYYNRDHAAALLSMSLCLALGFFIARMSKVRSSWRVAPPDWLRAQIGTACVLGLLLTGLALCSSRGAILGLAAGGGGILLLATRFITRSSRRRRIFLLLIGASAGAIALTYLSFYWNVNASGMIEKSTADRLSLYASGWRMLHLAPLFGWGLGAFSRVFAIYQSTDVVGRVEHIHNDWLELALQCGGVGLVAVLAAAAAFAFRSVRIWWKAESDEMRALMGGALAATLAFAVHGLVDFSSQIPADMAAAFVLAGLLSCSESWANKNPARKGTWPKWRWGLAPLFVGLALVASRPAIGAWYARQSEIAPIQSRASLLLRASDWDANPEYQYRLGINYFDLGIANPPARRQLMETAQSYAKNALAAEPLNPDYLYLMGALAWRLEGPEAGKEYIARAQKFRFDPVLPNRELTDRQILEAQLDALRGLKILPDEWKTR